MGVHTIDRAISGKHERPQRRTEPAALTGSQPDKWGEGVQSAYGARESASQRRLPG